MKTVVITDGKYRSSVAAARALGRAGYRVIAVQTRADCPLTPPVFASRFVSEVRWIDGSAQDAGYPAALLALLAEYPRPVLFCAGAATLNIAAARRAEFDAVCDALIAPPEVLDALNDKEAVHRRCVALGIPVPKLYSGAPDSYPVILKPHCGEKLGLKAGDRYAVAKDRQQYETCLAAMRRYDPSPIVQEQVSGAGAGVSLLLDRDSRLLCALCHRRIREYPITGGPSTCCESFYDADMIAAALRLLQSFAFTGMAMVEFKGDRVLEVNPRVWGSFPMTEQAGSPFVLRYAQAASGAAPAYTPGDYQTGVRMRFTLNDGAAAVSSLLRGRPGAFFAACGDLFRAKEALSARDDPRPFRQYLRNNLLRRS